MALCVTGNGYSKFDQGLGCVEEHDYPMLKFMAPGWLKLSKKYV